MRGVHLRSSRVQGARASSPGSAFKKIQGKCEATRTARAVFFLIWKPFQGRALSPRRLSPVPGPVPHLVKENVLMGIRKISLSAQCAHALAQRQYSPSRRNARTAGATGDVRALRRGARVAGLRVAGESSDCGATQNKGYCGARHRWRSCREHV
jgi:hypothetical protein